ncbi:hypothetical protein [Pseudomonas sp. DWRC2-2]|uniref:hypothetical protein n=1 Tax=Pseudomonas sp. DWRC2-2 TaxID=2804567 RepID=UPI003CEDBA82
MSSINGYPSPNQFGSPYAASAYNQAATGTGAGTAEDNFEQGEKINDYTTKKQLEAKLISGINQAAKGFQ